MLRVFAIAIVLLAATSTNAAAQSPSLSGLYINDGYSPRANPYRDLERAIERAAVQNRRVLIVVGGDWCVWCDILDEFLVADPEVRAAFEDSFVMLKVNMSRENQNTAFLSGFPDSAGYPDFFILETNGAFLSQQRTDVLEGGDSYDRQRMLAFARRWAR